MPVPYSNVFAVFSNKITDYSFSNLTKQEMIELFTVYLKSATVKFVKCKQNLFDVVDATEDSEGFFNNDLTGLEIEILANYMVDEWLSPKIHTSDLLQQILGNKDYKIWSQANHIKELRELRDDNRDEINRLLIEYTYSDLSINDIT